MYVPDEPAPDDYLQIIPAIGWYAVYQSEGGDEQLWPLVCWALRRDGDVVGIDADSKGMITASEGIDLVRYAYLPGLNPSSETTYNPK